MVVFYAVLRGVLHIFDVTGQGIRSTNGVFARNNSKRRVSFSAVNTFGDYGCDEFEDVGANSAGYLEGESVKQTQKKIVPARPGGSSSLYLLFRSP